MLSQRLTVIPQEELLPLVADASRFSPDPDDVMYFAAALLLDVPLWSNDKRLKEQDEVQIISTLELARRLGC